MKDGTVYKGKILLDSEKAVIIGNPPFDPNQYLLESKDIDTIVYEEYRLSPPAERKRGLMLEGSVSGNVFSSQELSLSPAAGLWAGAGFRVHPFFEINGGFQWLPSVHSSGGLSVSNGTTTRGYESFGLYSGMVSGRLYPLAQKKLWKTEPYVTLGYQWSRLKPLASGDTLKGTGWLWGIGFLRPLTTHIFWEGRFLYQRPTFDSIDFIGQAGTISPEITENQYSFSVGLSYRL